ncbi:uncharacterized protein LOC119590077 [Penaeus monodon]|uniref:uncharacterized protein LOC119590077 n=1 Tax=Penaeus monodon TaxID=6687 RepID=UPI0018A718D2|nr:uncharacterized protein LOC119590077 [Penaeus monodon]
MRATRTLRQRVFRGRRRWRTSAKASLERRHQTRSGGSSLSVAGQEDREGGISGKEQRHTQDGWPTVAQAEFVLQAGAPALVFKVSVGERKCCSLLFPRCSRKDPQMFKVIMLCVRTPFEATQNPDEIIAALIQGRRTGQEEGKRGRKKNFLEDLYLKHP